MIRLGVHWISFSNLCEEEYSVIKQSMYIFAIWPNRITSLVLSEEAWNTLKYYVKWLFISSRWIQDVISHYLWPNIIKYTLFLPHYTYLDIY